MKVKDLMKELSQLDQEAEVILYQGGENWPASYVIPGEMIDGYTMDGLNFKPDSESDADYYDGFDRSLVKVLYKAVCIE